MKDFLKLPKTKTLLWVLCGSLVILMVFGTGIIVGYRRAIFTERWGENYAANFYGAPGGNPMVGMMIHGPFDTHGVAGEVIDVGSSTISVQDPDGDEQSVFVSSATPIREMANTITLMSVSIGDHVTVIGEPNDSGQVEARFIRVFREPSSTQ